MENKYLDDIFDQVDATVFSSDALHNEESLKEFREYLARWQRETDRIEQMLEDTKYKQQCEAA